MGSLVIKLVQKFGWHDHQELLQICGIAADVLYICYRMSIYGIGALRAGSRVQLMLDTCQ